MTRTNDRDRARISIHLHPKYRLYVKFRREFILRGDVDVEPQSNRSVLVEVCHGVSWCVMVCRHGVSWCVVVCRGVS